MRVRGILPWIVAVVAVTATGGDAVRAARQPGSIQQPQQQTPPPQKPAEAGAQQPPVFKTGVQLVRVDVSVTGRNDQPVSDLKADEFIVTEDGVLQTVEQLRFVRLEGRRPEGDEESLTLRSQEQAEAEAAREDVRVFVIFFDEYHIDKLPQVTIPIRRALRDFVDRLWPTDLVAVMDPLTTLDGLKFTRTKQDLLDAIAKMEGRQGEYFPFRSVLEEAQMRHENPRRVRAQVTLSALEGLCIKLGGIRQYRSTVVFVSQGPPTMFGSGQGNLFEEVDSLTRAANRGNVTIVGVDPQSLGMAVNQDQRSILYTLAAETGGRAIVNTNAMEIGLSQVLQESTGYYVLGYTPTRTTDDGKYHKINVKVKRGGIKVAAREGYYAPSSKEIENAAVVAARKLPPAVSAAQETLQNSEPGRRSVEVWAGVSRGEDGRGRVVVTWGPPDIPDPLPITAVDMQVFPPKTNTPVAPVQTLKAGPAGSGLTPIGTLPLDAGDYDLRLQARTADNSIADRWAQPLHVPDFSTAAVSLATPIFYRAKSLPEFRAIRAARTPPPTMVRQFAHADRVLIDVECYTPAGSTEVAAIEAHVLTRDGRELTALPVPDLVNGKARFELPVGSLGKGTYTLRVRAKAGPAETEILTAFRVVP